MTRHDWAKMALCAVLVAAIILGVSIIQGCATAPPVWGYELPPHYGDGRAPDGSCCWRENNIDGYGWDNRFAVTSRDI